MLLHRAGGLWCCGAQNFDVRSLDLFADLLYREILELVDLDWAGKDYEDTCRRFHIMPRFSRNLPGLFMVICSALCRCYLLLA